LGAPFHWLAGLLSRSSGFFGFLGGIARDHRPVRRDPNDPLTIAVAIAALGLVALAASFLPAQRAARVQPMEALRYE